MKKIIKYDGPVVLVVMDGVGLSPRRSGNAVRQAHTEFLDHAITNYLNIPLAASGEAVGIMPGQMGNSEVGHNALGSGQIIKQGVAGVEEAFAHGDIWQSKAWQGMLKFLKPEKTLHFAGIFSDGAIHSDIRHLEQMVARAYEDGIKHIRLHCIFDGRDVAPQSEPKYINRIEKFFSKFKDADFRIASGGGRMIYIADRYENDWGMVQLGWQAMVYGKAPRQFDSATEAIKTFRTENPKVQDQYLPAFVVKSTGHIVDGDAVIYYDFRADRAVEIARAFTEKIFDGFDRSAKPSRDFDPQHNPLPNVYFASLTEYDSDRHIPSNVLVPSVKISTPLNVFLGQHGIKQFAVSETVKFGHITYYFNGNSYKLMRGEKHLEIPSDTDTSMFRVKPWMKAAEITDAVLDNLEKFDFIRINYPNGDMVGHFGELEPCIAAMEAIDLQLARLAEQVDRLGGMMLITADHGNAEEVISAGGDPKTSHTTNPVPCIFYDNTKNAKLYHRAKLSHPGLANMAATISLLLGEPDYPAFWQKPLVIS